jgi:hypothetical protein
VADRLGFRSLQDFCDWVVALVVRFGGSLDIAYRCASVLAADPDLAWLDEGHDNLKALKKEANPNG